MSELTIWEHLSKIIVYSAHISRATSTESDYNNTSLSPPDPSPHLAKKERLRERKDAYLTKLRATTTQDASSSTATQTSQAPESPSRAEGRENTTRGRGQQGRGREGGRGKHGKAAGEKYNRNRGRYGKNKKNGKNGYKHGGKDNYYGRMDKYNVST